jgi:two-component system CheB/CheR fusion protein
MPSEPQRIAWHFSAVVTFPPNPISMAIQLPATIDFCDDGLRQIITLLREYALIDFSAYKTSAVIHRITHRLQALGFASMSRYADYLARNQNETGLLRQELLIGVTHFFREPHAWDALAAVAFPSPHQPTRVMRAWIPACSTGEDAYSLAISFLEAMEQAPPEARYTLKIFATDISAECITQARRGLFAPKIANHLSPQRLARYFVPHEGGFKATASLRDMVVFGEHDLLSDPGFINIDLLICRNLLIYLMPAAQQHVLQAFHRALNPDGLLLLGDAEPICESVTQFVRIDSAAQLHRRSGLAQTRLPRLSPGCRPVANTRPPQTPPQTPPHSGLDTLQTLLQATLLHHHTPPAVLVTADGAVICSHGDVGPYLCPPAGQGDMNVHLMLHHDIRYPVGAALVRMPLDRSPVMLSQLEISFGIYMHKVNITLDPVDECDPHGLIQESVLITFIDCGYADTPLQVPAPIATPEFLLPTVH